MELDSRKQMILKAVVEGYVNTAEPVGSRSISKNLPVSISAATIRNEMGDLEEMGLLQQLHTSSGRVPSQLGYRYYVDTLMQQYKVTAQEIVEIRNAMEHKKKQLDDMIRHFSKMFSKLTNLPTITQFPSVSYGTIKNIKLIGIDDNNIMVIIVTASGIIKDRKLHIKSKVTTDFLEELTNVLNQNLSGLTMNEINFTNIINVQSAMSGNYEMLSSILDFVYEAICEMEDSDVVVEGVSNILQFPEYSDIEKAKNILRVFDDKRDLNDALKVIPQTDNVSIIIGEESKIPDLKDCSIIMSRYTAGTNIMGTIGIIGPTRINYSKVASRLQYFTNELSEKLENEFADIQETEDDDYG